MKSGEKWCRRKLVKSGEKWRKAAKSGDKRRKVAKSGEKWRKGAKRGEKGRKAAKSGEKRSFQINTQLFFLIFFSKIAASGHFGSQLFPKSIGSYLYSRSVTISNMKLIGVFLSAQAFSSYFHKMAVGGHFGFPIFSKVDRVLPL